ncbi:cytochrome c oxidase subunit 8B, mitochondrial-like [Gracilinanus agilis]|uniref:cytochrome c oxidase subunit 8B, mitochondrial-like n=1 Tax=Gracilinanus agilis TaxID=191870 RepID=UPI001CFD46C3|nr:cytochrome c oxidase subunit 8B, mitochondrial-like [Gracilinanus agilis]
MGRPSPSGSSSAWHLEASCDRDSCCFLARCNRHSPGRSDPEGPFLVDGRSPEAGGPPHTMQRLTRASRLLQASLRGSPVLRAHISARPARDPTSSGEQAAALVVTFLTFLGPPAWILAHFDSYKKASG